MIAKNISYQAFCLTFTIAFNKQTLIQDLFFKDKGKGRLTRPISH
jgi:hypothetical protein